MLHLKAERVGLAAEQTHHVLMTKRLKTPLFLLPFGVDVRLAMKLNPCSSLHHGLIELEKV